MVLVTDTRATTSTEDPLDRDRDLGFEESSVTTSEDQHAAGRE